MNFPPPQKHQLKKLHQWLQHKPVTADLPNPAAEAMLAATLAKLPNYGVLWVLESDEAADHARQDLITLSPDLHLRTLRFASIWTDANSPTPSQEALDAHGERFQTLHQLKSFVTPNAPIILTTWQALSQPVPSPQELAVQSLRLNAGARLGMSPVIDFLVTGGYQQEGEVLEKGQFAKRGGILDIWPSEMDSPLRVEWFGDDIDVIRIFDPLSQRTIGKVPEMQITPLRSFTQHSGNLIDHIQTPVISLWQHDFTQPTADEASTEVNITQLVELISAADHGNRIICNPIDEQPHIPPIEFTPLNNPVMVPATSGTQQLHEARQQLFKEIASYRQQGLSITYFFDTDGAREHFINHLADQADTDVNQVTGHLSAGFVCPTLKWVAVAESDIYGRRRIPTTASRKQRHAGTRIADFTDIEPGDLVVHIEHGVGRYIGITEITFNNQPQEVLAIEYADSAKLYVPVTHVHLLSRYVGIGTGDASLHRLGGKRWQREKGAAQDAIMDMAADLLEVQARRNLLKGHAFSPDSPLQHEFENAFPYSETEDQATVIEAVRKDMESLRPMDRLICGDAGYGKTEVAMRAAFKAVEDGMQVGMLVPTTVLAQQHYETFAERMAGFDLNIKMISRFQSPAQRRQILEDLRHGKIDIIIGTHALVQPSVRFANLGLVIIDEEQRFGVKHKESLKSIRALVDVLTLSATPIPRTLYMSMTGARDLSVIRTPPRQRVPIETIAAANTDETIQHAIRREFARHGQVYYLHNRIQSIHAVYERLASLVPEVRIDIAHGRLKSNELAGVMHRFASGHTDVLLCTTIIESGIDFPRANTILIDRADRFGIADLYQLRGRVGRGDRKAYAYLLLPSHGWVDRSARERIHAIRQHTHLGAGFNLAVKDMEIRGAGNILGAAQSGHISAIGFGLYCKLLQRAVARLKGQPEPMIPTEVRLDFISTDTMSGSAHACILESYINDDKLRIAFYRRLAEADSISSIKDLKDELRDRFGSIPQETLRLINIAEIRVLANHAGIELVEARNKKLMLRRNNQWLTHSGQFPSMNGLDPDENIAAIKTEISRFSPTAP